MTKEQKQKLLNKESKQIILDIKELLKEIENKENFDFKDFSTLSTVFLTFKQNFNK